MAAALAVHLRVDLMKISPNEPCDCGSGRKFKKCCGARGRVTVVSVAEGMAHSEERWREHAKKPKSKRSKMPFFLFASMMSLPHSGPGPAPLPPKKRGRRKPL